MLALLIFKPDAFEMILFLCESTLKPRININEYPFALEFPRNACHTRDNLCNKLISRLIYINDRVISVFHLLHINSTQDANVCSYRVNVFVDRIVRRVHDRRDDPCEMVELKAIARIPPFCTYRTRYRSKKYTK